MQLKWIVTTGTSVHQETLEVWAFDIQEAIQIAYRLLKDEPMKKMITKAELSK